MLYLTGEQVNSLAEVSDGTKMEIEMERDGLLYARRAEDGFTVLIDREGGIAHIGGPVSALDALVEKLDSKEAL